MDMRDQLNHWLAQRVHGAALDEDGISGLLRDDQTLIMLEVPAHSSLCHFSAPAVALPEDDPVAGLLTALELNRYGRPLGGCWLAWDPDIQRLMLCFNLLIPDSDARSFENALDNFIAALDLVRSSFNADAAAKSQTEAMANKALV